MQWWYEYLNYLRWQIEQIMASIDNILWSYGILLLIWYLVVIVIIVILSHYMHKMNNNITHLLGKIVDEIIYKQNTLIYNNRESIYNGNESLSVLYVHTQDMLANPLHRDYSVMYPFIKQEKEYADIFFSKTTISWQDSNDKVYKLSLSIRDRYHAIQKTLIYLTLWVAKIFL